MRILLFMVGFMSFQLGWWSCYLLEKHINRRSEEDGQNTIKD